VGYYEARIKTIHPESRFGIFPAAPLGVDDFCDLYRLLTEVYSYLLTDYIPDEPQDDSVDTSETDDPS
jgi:hypothetical protein